MDRTVLRHPHQRGDQRRVIPDDQVAEEADVLFAQSRDILLQGGNRMPQMVLDIILQALETLVVAVDVLEGVTDPPVQDGFRHDLRFGELFVFEQPSQAPIPVP